MRKSLIKPLAAFFVLSAASAMAQQKMHEANGKVTKVDTSARVATLAHGPVKSLNWPAMVMGFKVKDKMAMDKLTVGKTVDFEFAQADKGYVIFKVK